MPQRRREDQPAGAGQGNGRSEASGGVSSDGSLRHESPGPDAQAASAKASPRDPLRPHTGAQAAAHIALLIKKAKKKRNHPLLGAACKQYLVLGDASEGSVARNTYRRGFEMRTEVNPENESAATLAQAALTNLTKTKRILAPNPSDASEPAKLGRGSGRSSAGGSRGGPKPDGSSAASRGTKPAITAEKLAAELQKAAMRGQKLCLEFSPVTTRDSDLLADTRQDLGKLMELKHSVECLVGQIHTAEQLEAKPQ